MGLRWIRRRLMWRLRNRLIVTYIFIGVIPIMLLVAMARLAGYLFAGQFATYVAIDRIAIGAAASGDGEHRAGGRSFAAWRRNGQPDRATGLRNCPRLGRKFSSSHRDRLGRRSVVSLSLPSARASRPNRLRCHREIKGNFSGIVVDGKRLHLRAVRRFEEGTHRFIVISNVPITPTLLRSAASQLGSLTILPPRTRERAAHPSRSLLLPRAGCRRRQPPCIPRLTRQAG